MKLLHCLVAVAVVMFAMGCASTPDHQAQQAQWQAEREAARQQRLAEKRNYFAENPHLSLAIVRAINEGGIARGMDEKQVSLAIGRPERINNSTGGFGRHDQWVYASGALYLYFKDGILDSWQSSETIKE